MPLSVIRVGINESRFATRAWVRGKPGLNCMTMHGNNNNNMSSCMQSLYSLQLRVTLKGFELQRLLQEVKSPNTTNSCVNNP